MNRLQLMTLSLITTVGFAQTKLTKTSQSIDVSKDVVVDLNTNYVELEIDTWNKDEVVIEAYIVNNKLSKEDLEKALKSWNLKVDASSDHVTISSEGGRSIGLFNGNADYDVFLKDLEFELSDLPEVVVVPNPPSMGAMPPLPDMPEMPKFPELPELPEGVSSIYFDHEKYKEEGESYLDEWSKRFEEEGGKELRERMEAWAKKFSESGYQEKMEAWGNAYAEKFEGDWAKEMEKWGEEFGEKYAEDMEKWGEEFGEKFGKEWAQKMEAWGERLGRQIERSAQRDALREQRKSEQEQRRAKLEALRRDKEISKAERRAQIEARKAEIVAKRIEQKLRQAERQKLVFKNSDNVFFLKDASLNSENLKKVIKLKVPKKAKLKLNVRHGELKVSSLTNVKGNIAHAFVVADYIDGSDTSINVSYSPLLINTWKSGALNLSFVDKAQIKDANYLMLNSKSSNIIIDAISDTAIIDGSFGDLTIGSLTDSFKNVNLVLENSDALINIPENLSYNLYFKGSRSKFNNKPTTQKTITKDNSSNESNKIISVNAKYSNLLVN